MRLHSKRKICYHRQHGTEVFPSRETPVMETNNKNTRKGTVHNAMKTRFSSTATRQMTQSPVKAELRPTLWRTARALANIRRIELLRLIYTAVKPLDVTMLSERIQLSIPTTSAYLRALNARGLISVIRSGAFVYYGNASDRSLPTAEALQSSFRHLFKGDLPQDWARDLVALFRGYAHPRRETIIRLLNELQPVAFCTFQRACGFSPTSLLRHISVLVRAGIVLKGEDRLYSLKTPSNQISAIMFESLCPGKA